MGKLQYSLVVLLSFAGSVRSQVCKLGDVPVQENFNEKKVIFTILQFVLICKQAGACPGFLGSLKKGHQILKGGVQWSDGGVQYISLRTTNLAYLDAKE